MKKKNHIEYFDGFNF